MQILASLLLVIENMMPAMPFSSTTRAVAVMVAVSSSAMVTTGSIDTLSVLASFPLATSALSLDSSCDLRSFLIFSFRLSSPFLKTSFSSSSFLLERVRRSPESTKMPSSSSKSTVALSMSHAASSISPKRSSVALPSSPRCRMHCDPSSDMVLTSSSVISRPPEVPLTSSQ